MSCVKNMLLNLFSDGKEEFKIYLLVVGGGGYAKSACKSLVSENFSYKINLIPRFLSFLEDNLK